jgi:type I restriction enzyme M protein
MIRLAFEGGVGTEIICANALVENEELNNTFDVVLTNPPFGSKGKVEEQKILKFYQLARKWNKSHNGDWEVTRSVFSGQSPEILFIEKCLKLLRPGGRMAIVLPDGLLQNVSNGHVRFWICSQARVLAVVSIPQEAFVPYGTGIKTSVLILQKLPVDTTKMFMARIQKVGYDLKGQPIYKRDNDGTSLKRSSGLPVVDDDIDEIISAYSKFKEGNYKLESETMYVIPEGWLNTRLDVEHYQPNDRRLLERLEAIGAKPLGELADILKETDDFRLASDGKIRYIAISDVDTWAMQVLSQQIIKSHEAPSRATYRVCKGNIITAVSGASTGTSHHTTALITEDEDEDEDGAICSNGFAVLRNIHGIEPLFLLAYMRTEYYLRQVRRLMTGHAIPAISTEDLSKVLVPIPPTEVQKRISEEISTIVAKRKETLKAGEKVVEDTACLIGRIISRPAETAT